MLCTGKTLKLVGFTVAGLSGGSGGGWETIQLFSVCREEPSSFLEQLPVFLELSRGAAGWRGWAYLCSGFLPLCCSYSLPGCPAAPPSVLVWCWWSQLCGFSSSPKALLRLSPAIISSLIFFILADFFKFLHFQCNRFYFQRP